MNGDGGLGYSKGKGKEKPGWHKKSSKERNGSIFEDTFNCVQLLMVKFVYFTYSFGSRSVVDAIETQADHNFYDC